MKRNFYSLLICAIVVAGFSVISASAQAYGDRNRPAGDGRYNIVVKVLLPDGKPAAGAAITMSSADVGGSGAGTTDMEGMYTFPNFPAGNYHFTAKVEGFPNESENLTIERGGSTSQAYNLIIYFRNPGQKKGDFYSSNPLFKDISKEALEKFKKGMDKIAKNDNKGAIPLFDEAIGLYPQFAPAYYEKGAAYLKLAEYDKAVPAFVKAIEIKPDYVEAKYSLGLTYLSMKNYEVSAAIFGDVIREKKDMPEAFMNLGIALVYLKKPDQAEIALKEAIKIRDGEKIALAHRYLAGIYMQKKKNAEAIGELEKYLELVPKVPDADKLRQTINDLKKQG